MRKGLTARSGCSSQRGYALLVVMFLLALLVLTTITIVPNVVTEGQREKEKEMVWRGKQYIRGVRRYYMKMHRFPTELDDLVKPKTGIRFMRQAYKDPMNDVDGSWRLIYVGPNGQLIGSLKPQVLGAGGIGTPASMMPGAQSPGSSFGSSSFGGSSFGQSSFGGSSFGSSGQNQASQPGANANTQNPAGTDSMSTPQPIAPAETPTIIGGNIIGVGSKVNKASFMVYEKANNYRQFEFIWDPTKDMLGGFGAPMQTGPGLGSQVGAPGVSSPFSNQNPSQNPGNNPIQSPPGLPEGGPPLQAPPPSQN